MALTATVALLATKWPVSAATRDRMADKFARKVDLALPAELRPLIGHRLVRRARFLTVAAGVAIGAYIVFIAWIGIAWIGGSLIEGRDFALGYLGFVAIVQLSMAIALLATQIRDRVRQEADRPRTAHLPRPRVDDFVTPLELWWSRGSATLATLVAAFLLAREPDPGRLALVVACLGIWILVEVSTQALVAARAAASDVQSLAFDDALRAEAVRRMLQAPSLLPFVLAIAGSSLGLSFPASSALVGVYAASLILATWVQSSAHAKRHFRQRLWPSPVR
ncbi:MAG TPA: hypothetical protein VKG45_01840 [Actinomycetes bacterium]|nr:hypothetical protein [Actinomycetes bacterium]